MKPGCGSHQLERQALQQNRQGGPSRGVDAAQHGANQKCASVPWVKQAIEPTATSA